MLTTNLLPIEDKKLVRLEEARRLILFFAGGFVAVFVVSSVLLSPSFLPLFFERRELERSLQLEEEAGRALGVAGTRTRLSDLRMVISSVKLFVSRTTGASQILEEFWQQSRDGVQLSNVTLKKGGEAILTGTAQKRSDLLRFEKILRDSGKFQDLSSPLSNIIRETNINFTLQGKLKPAFGL